jgi:hypothetical protein
MPSADVRCPVPLVRQKPWFPGQFGVPGTDSERGLRTHVTGTIFYVDPNAPGTSDQRDGTDPEAPLASVAQALTLCQPYRGDVIAVMANSDWVYADTSVGYATAIREEVIVSVAGISIVGVFPSGSPGVPWYTVTAAGAGTCITINAMDVRIEGFAFCGGLVGGTGIHADWDGTDTFGDSATIRNCLFDEDLDNGITLDFTYYMRILNNWFQQCGTNGIYQDPADTEPAYCEVANNWFIECSTQIDVEFQYSDIHHNHLLDTVLGAGDGIDLTNGSNNLVHQNVLPCPLGAGAGQYGTYCAPGAGDMWVQNYCTTGPTITNP